MSAPEASEPSTRPPDIGLQRQDGVAVLSLHAPQRRNAFTAEMVRQLLAACDEVDADERIGAVVVIRADGPTFCAGADRAVLSQVAGDPAAPDAYALLTLVYQAFVRVGSLRPPTIAAVRGHALGAGINLLLATDLRIVATSARIVSGFLPIGLHPGGGHFALLGRLAGREAAAALGVFGQEVDGNRAVALGLAWEALPEDQVEPRALELAAHAARDPELARATVASFRLELAAASLDWPVALQMERAPQMWSLRRRAQTS